MFFCFCRINKVPEMQLAKSLQKNLRLQVISIRAPYLALQTADLCPVS